MKEKRQRKQQRRRRRVPRRAAVVRQNSDARDHTGGIVWETSYLLANFLLWRGRRRQRRRRSGPQDGGGEVLDEGDVVDHSCDGDGESGGNRRRKDGRGEEAPRPLGRVLELGSGCGMLGLVLAASGLAERVVLTEAEEVMEELRGNVERNVEHGRRKMRTKTTAGRRRPSSTGVGEEEGGGEGGGSDHSPPPSRTVAAPSTLRPCVPPDRVSVRRLRWDRLPDDVAAAGGEDLVPHTFDTILGTDVVFAPHLVEPLLRTMAEMAHSETDVYLCHQVRCADSHQLLLETAGECGFRVEDRTEELRDIPGCWWGREMECKLLQFVRTESGGRAGERRCRGDAGRGGCTKRKKKKKSRKAE